MTPASGDRVFYVDTSVLLRALLGDSAAAVGWFNDRHAARDLLVSSHLIAPETWRPLRNRRLCGEPVVGDDDVAKWLARIGQIDVTRALLDQAGQLDAELRTADAIHVATAISLAPRRVVVVTHDAQMAAAVERLTATYPTVTVLDPVTDDPRRAPVAPGAPS